MKYTTEITIDCSISEVIKKMDSADNLKHWQKGLVSVEHISGVPGQFGAKMKLNYKYGNRKMELIETITKQDFPYEFHATYSTKGMNNLQLNYFEALTEEKTKWVCISEFQPTSFFMRAMLFLMPRSFKKQTAQFMLNFKNFVEKGTSVCDS